MQQKPHARTLDLGPSRARLPPSIRPPELDEIHFDRPSLDAIDLKSLASDRTTYFSRLPTDLLMIIERSRDVSLKHMPEKRWRVVVVGDPRVGKGSLVKRFMHGTFDEHAEDDMADEVTEKVWVRLGRSTDPLPMTITHWRPRALRFRLRLDYRSNIAIIVFDLCDQQSWLNVKKYLQEQERYTHAQFIICGTKSDLLQTKPRVVEESVVHEFCLERNIPYIETSAKDDINVTRLFQQACAMICAQDPDKWGVPIEEPPQPKEEKGCILQ